MAFIIKCNPVPLSVGGRIVLEAPIYEDADPAAGDAIFIWFSESAGGTGLAGRGVVQAVSHDDPIDVAILVEATSPITPMQNRSLRVSRNAGDGSPIGALSRKLYRNSLNKVAHLEEPEAERLMRQWDKPSASNRSRYEPLREWLLQQADREIILTLQEIEEVLGVSLPASSDRPQWWANTTKAHTNVQREAWRAAGYDAFLMKDQGRVRFVKTASQDLPE
jgi:hypothetical protein